MAEEPKIKFPKSRIDYFGDKIENCLEDSDCRCILKYFLDNVIKKRHLKDVFGLWIKAHNRDTLDDDDFDEIDGFIWIAFLNVLKEPEDASNQEKRKKAYDYVKYQSCLLFNKANIHKSFIQYLNEKHKRCSPLPERK